MAPKDPKVTDVIYISAGRDHTCALKKDSTVTCWNHNKAPKVPKVTNVIQIAAGDYYTCALKKDGTVIWWESNDHKVDPPQEVLGVVHYYYPQCLEDLAKRCPKWTDYGGESESVAK